MPTLTPEQTFGFGSVPLTSYFKAPPGGSRNTMFSPQARAMLQQGEAYQREQDQIDEQQRQMDADQLVNELLGQAPNLSDDQINQALIQNPNIFRGRDAGLIQNYQQFRQQAATPADQKLGEYFYTKIQDNKDPRHLQNFKRRMLDEGMTANDAWEAYRRDEFNDQHANSLAELGVPDTEFDQLKNQEGYFDPTLVTRRASAAKAEAEARKLGEKAHPLDAEIKFLDSSMEARRKHLEALQKPVAGDKVYTDLAAQREAKTAARSLAFNPVVAPKLSVGKPVQVSGEVMKQGAAPTVSATPPVFDITVSPEENQKRQEKYGQQAKEREVADTIARAWTNKKMELTDKIASVYKSPEEILAVAHAISANGPITVQGKTVPYLGYIADKIGIKSSDTAFEEPENNRWGTQSVTNNELLKEWADSILKVYKAQAASNAEQTGQPAPASGKFSVGAPVKVGGP